MKKKLLGGMLAAMLSISLIGCGSGQGSSGDEIVIGGIMPLTGVAATYGQSVKNGADVYLEQINAKGGIQNKDIQNTLHSAGLVGYFYTTDTTFDNEYLISGFKVNATMYNVTDAAGLVAYLGNNSASAEETSTV